MSENTCKRELLIEVPADVVSKAVDKVARDIQRQARIPGFRPGKAPMTMIRQRFADHIREEVLKELVPAHFRERALEEKVSPVAMPAFEDVHLHDDEPLKFKAVFEVLPEFELSEYHDLEVEYADPVVTDSELDKGLERMRENNADYTPVEGRPLEMGDFAEVSFEGHPVGSKGAPVKVDNVLVEVGGKETLKEFSENLAGAEAGGEREFTVAYPADYHDDRLAGRTLRYKVQVHTIKAKELPELDDDFAKSQGEGYDTLEELRNNLRDRLFQQKKNRAEQEAKQKLVDQLVTANEFPVPDALVERQLEIRAERLARELTRRGVDPSKVFDWPKWRESNLEPARRDVRGELILNRIAEQEHIEVSEEDYTAEVRYMARALRQSEEHVRARLKREEREGGVKYQIRNGKAQDFVFRVAKPVAPAGEAAPPELDAAEVAAEVDEEEEEGED